MDYFIGSLYVILQSNCIFICQDQRSWLLSALVSWPYSNWNTYTIFEKDQNFQRKGIKRKVKKIK